MNRKRVLVARVGNIFLGNDAFGVEVVRALAKRSLPENVRVTDFGIRGLDLMYALCNGSYTSVILVDAAPRGGQPGTLCVIEPEPIDLEEEEVRDVLLEGHDLDPVKILQMAAAMGSPVRRLFVVGCEQCEADNSEVEEAVCLIESLVSKLRSESGSIVMAKKAEESCRT